MRKRRLVSDIKTLNEGGGLTGRSEAPSTQRIFGAYIQVSHTKEQKNTKGTTEARRTSNTQPNSVPAKDNTLIRCLLNRCLLNRYWLNKWRKWMDRCANTTSASWYTQARKVKIRLKKKERKRRRKSKEGKGRERKGREEIERKEQRRKGWAKSPKKSTIFLKSGKQGRMFQKGRSETQRWVVNSGKGGRPSVPVTVTGLYWYSKIFVSRINKI